MADRPDRALPRETPAWGPLTDALARFAGVWEDPHAGSEDVVSASDVLVAAWRAYRQQRYGGSLVDGAAGR